MPVSQGWPVTVPRHGRAEISAYQPTRSLTSVEVIPRNPSCVESDESREPDTSQRVCRSQRQSASGPRVRVQATEIVAGIGVRVVKNQVTLLVFGVGIRIGHKPAALRVRFVVTVPVAVEPRPN